MELTIHDVMHIFELGTKVILNLICIFTFVQKKDGPPADDRQPVDRPR